MRKLNDIAKDVKTWYDDTKPDILSQDDLNCMITFLEGQARMEEELRECAEELVDDYYVDPSELRGMGGHYADEDMYDRLDDEEEEEL